MQNAESRVDQKRRELAALQNPSHLRCVIRTGGDLKVGTWVARIERAFSAILFTRQHNIAQSEFLTYCRSAAALSSAVAAENQCSIGRTL
jgi:hypothetical protein